MPRAVLLKLDLVSDHLEGTAKHRLLRPTPRASDPVDVRLGPQIFIPNKVPGDADAAGLGTTF